MGETFEINGVRAQYDERGNLIPASEQPPLPNQEQSINLNGPRDRVKIISPEDNAPLRKALGLAPPESRRSEPEVEIPEKVRETPPPARPRDRRNEAVGDFFATPQAEENARRQRAELQRRLAEEPKPPLVIKPKAETTGWASDLPPQPEPKTLTEKLDRWFKRTFGNGA